MLCGLLKPEKGEILLKGKPMEETATNIGYMLQKDHLLNGAPYTAMFCWVLRYRRKNPKKILKEQNISLPITGWISLRIHGHPSFPEACVKERL